MEWKLDSWWKKTIYIIGWFFFALIMIGVIRGFIR